MSDKLADWLKTGEYMPPEFRDFHNQKDLFKAIHNTIHNANENGNPRDGHIYVVDTFLWYMARCGWTLQRSRKQVPFRDVNEDIRRSKKELREAFERVISR